MAPPYTGQVHTSLAANEAPGLAVASGAMNEYALCYDFRASHPEAKELQVLARSIEDIGVKVL